MPQLDELRLGSVTFQHDRLSNSKLVKVRRQSAWNTAPCVNLCNLCSDGSLSMKDDRNPIEASFRSAVSVRRGWQRAATFDAQAFEIVSKTKHGCVYIPPSCEALTKAHHVWSARREDFFGPPISRASVSCAPHGCDRDRSKGSCAAVRIVSPPHSSLLIHQTLLKPHILHYCYFPNEHHPFTRNQAAAAVVAPPQSLRSHESSSHYAQHVHCEDREVGCALLRAQCAPAFVTFAKLVPNVAFPGARVLLRNAYNLTLRSIQAF